MRKLIGKITEIDQNKITFEILSDVPCDILEETKLENEDTLIVEMFKHKVIIRKI